MSEGPGLRRRIAAFIDPSITVKEAVVKVDSDEDQWRALGASHRQLHHSILARAQDMSIHLYRSNPIANRILKIYTSYMAGEGFTVEAQNPAVQEVADEFWFAERNQMHRNHRGFARDFLSFGEGIHPVGVDEVGSTTIGFIDPMSIDHIERSQLNAMILEAVVLSRLGSMSGDTPPLMVVRKQSDPFEDEAGLYVGDVFAWLHDRIGASSRGTPFLLPALDWLDAYDQTLWELLERVKAVRAFFWDVEVEGGATEVEEAQKLWGTTAPRSGSVRFRSNAMKVEAAQPQIGAYEDVAAARYLLRHIATAAGVAPHWLGDPEDANRATAESMDGPVFRALVEVQSGWRANMTDLMRYVVDQKVAAGILERRMPVFNEQGEETEEILPTHDLISVITPNITDDDVVAAAGALASIATAFVQLNTAELADANMLRMVVRQMIPALGIPLEELPEPDEDDTAEERLDRDMAFLESVYGEARRGRLDQLLERIDA